MKKKIFNYATREFENLNAEDDIQEMKEKEFKTLKPNAVPPKTETFKKTVVTPSGDIFDAIYDEMNIFEKGHYNQRHTKQYGVTYVEARNKRLKKNN